MDSLKKLDSNNFVHVRIGQVLSKCSRGEEISESEARLLRQEGF